jgi:dTDP-4-dehydrorhamnose 3,5-epimerase
MSSPNTMSRFDFVETRLSGLKVIQRKPIQDHRGFLSRLYCADEFSLNDVIKPLVQINHTYTRNKGAVRGMHYQKPPFSETKIISCLKGEIFDVAVDLRKDSPTFLNWHAEVLSQSNNKSFVIPEGFAHGFQTLTEDCELIYFHTAPYSKEFEGGLNPMDSKLNIEWPLEITEISERDSYHPLIRDIFFEGIIL